MKAFYALPFWSCEAEAMVKIAWANRPKRGFLFSFSAFLLGSVLLYLVVSASLYSNSLKTTSSSLANFERINAQFDSAYYGMRTIFTAEVAKVTVSGTNVSFEENLSVAGKGNYSSHIAGFKQFLESRSGINLSLDITGAARPRLYLRPQGIVVDHAAGRVNFTPLDSPASAGNVSGYTILIKVNQPLPQLKWVNLSTLPQSDPNAMYLFIGVQGSDGATSDSEYLNKFAYSELRLLDVSNQSVVTIQAVSPAAIAVNYNSDAYLKTTIQLNSSTSVELDASINASLGNDGEKIGKVIPVEN